MNNTVQKLYVSAEISKGEAKRLHLSTIEDIRNYVLENDCEPREGKAYSLSEELAEAKADMDFNGAASIEVFENKGVKFLRVAFGCLEYFEADEDGEYRYGSDYNEFASFSAEDEKIILNFLK